MLTIRLLPALLALLVLAPAPMALAQAQPKAKAAKQAAAKKTAPENPPVVKPTLAEVRYGPHERHVLDFWRAALPPPWMIGLWALFASTLNVSLNWLKKHTALAILLGAISGPLCYWAGERLGALSLLNFNSAMVYLALGWAIAVPLLLKLATAIGQAKCLIKED